jgi:hypothetical protein
MNVATRLKIEQMEKDVASLKLRAQLLEDALACVLANQKPSPEPQYDPAFDTSKKTLTLPEKRKSA